jgi:lipid-binding SYLF domain-containing protein
MRKVLTYAAPLVLAGMLAGAPAYAADTQTSADPQALQNADADDMEDAHETVAEAAALMATLKADPKVAPYLESAQGVFLVPTYARGGLVAGASGGEGVMVQRTANGWSAPLFYNVGGISIGAQAGFEKGAVAFLLMNDKATAEFAQQDNFSLDADAGLTIVDYQAAGQASSGKGDVIVWSDKEGAFAGAMVGVSDIKPDDEENAAFYGKVVEPGAVLSGAEKGPANNPLR